MIGRGNRTGHRKGRPSKTSERRKKWNRISEYREWFRREHGCLPEEISFVEFLRRTNAITPGPDGQIGRRTPELHIEICEWLEDTMFTDKNRILQAYRHRGKRHLVTLYVAWLLMQDPDRCIIIIRSKEKLARRNSKGIRSIIETNPLTKHLVPVRPEEWTKISFTVERITNKLNDSVMMTRIEADFTGLHGDWLIGDDIETSENTSTTDAREWLEFRAEEFPSLAPRSLMVGTPHHTETIYDKLVHRRHFLMAKWPVWKDAANRITQNPDIEIDGQLQDADWVDQMQASMAEGRFKSQYLLIPAKAEDSLMDEELIEEFDSQISFRRERLSMTSSRTFWTIDDEEIVEMRAYWDPASGLAGRDRSVIRIVGRTDHDHVYLFAIKVLQAVGRNSRFRGQCKQVIELAHSFGITRVHVESNFNPSLGAELMEEARKLRRKLTTRKVTRKRSQNKERFIADNLEPVIKSGRLHAHKKVLYESPFLAELREFPKGKHDDCLDAVAGAIAELHVKQGRTGDRRPKNAWTPPGGGSGVINKYEPLAAA